MWSLAVIDYLNQQAAKKARQRSATPFVPDGPEAVESWPPFPFPNLGDYDQPGWERADESWFVDKTGWGRSGNWPRPGIGSRTSCGTTSPKTLGMVSPSPKRGSSSFTSRRFARSRECKPDWETWEGG